MSNKASMLSHLESLKHKHAALEQRILKSPDLVARSLKKQKLQLKDQIYALEQQLQLPEDTRKAA